MIGGFHGSPHEHQGTDIPVRYRNKLDLTERAAALLAEAKVGDTKGVGGVLGYRDGPVGMGCVGVGIRCH